MIKFGGETKNGNGSRSAPPAGYRCGCQKCRFHDEHPELVGRPLTPEEFTRIYPQPAHVPTTYTPEIDEAWAAVEVAQIAYGVADKVWEEAIRKQSRERLERMRDAPKNVLPFGGSPTPDSAEVEIAKEDRKEAAERLLRANVKYSGLLRAFEYRANIARHEAELERARQEEADKKAAKRARLFGR